MTAVSVLLILVGIFIVINAPNFVGVVKGDKKISLLQGSSSTSPLTGTSSPIAGK